MNARVASWFATLTLRQRLALAVASVLVLGNLALHRTIERTCEALSSRYGFAPYDRAMFWGLVLASGAALLAVAVRLRSRPRSWEALAIVVLLGALTFMSQRLLLVANVELVHLPQFGLLAGALLAGGVGIRPAWVLASLGGVVDELYQRFFIYADQSFAYLDYNDMVLNVIGAAWAVMLVAFSRENTVACAAADGRPGRTQARLWVVVGTGFALFAALLAIDRFYIGTLTETASFGRDYRRVSFGEGALLFGLVWGLTWLLPTRRPAARAATSDCNSAAMAGPDSFEGG